MGKALRQYFSSVLDVEKGKAAGRIHDRANGNI